MPRRFQFSLRAVFRLTTKTAIGCAIWAYLPSDMRHQSIVGFATSVVIGVVWVCIVPRRYWHSKWDPMKQSGPPCVARRHSFCSKHAGKHGK